MIAKNAHLLAREAREEFKHVLAEYFAKNTMKSNYLKLVPQLHQKLFYNLYTGKNKSYAKAVKAKCLDCTCFNKEEVKHCVVETCPLFNLRPYRD